MTSSPTAPGLERAPAEFPVLQAARRPIGRGDLPKPAEGSK